MIRTGVIAAAGRGTRMLPFTAFVPKEMLPLGSVPVIQYVVEELIDAGIEKLVVIVSHDKQTLIDFFDISKQRHFINGIKDEGLKVRQRKFLDGLERLEVVIDFQEGHYGNATPLKVATKHLDREPFFYTWADDFIISTPSRFKQLAAAYDTHGVTILSGIRANQESDYDKYAYVESNVIDGKVHTLKRIHEKPGFADAPSDLGVLSGHLFSPDILDYIHRLYEAHDDKQGEFLFNAILHEMINEGHNVIVCEIDRADYVDTGNITSYYQSYGKFVT